MPTFKDCVQEEGGDGYSFWEEQFLMEWWKLKPFGNLEEPKGHGGCKSSV